MKYAKGIMWLDNCRIPFVSDDLDDVKHKRKSFTKTGNGYKNLYVGGLLENPIDTLTSVNDKGRFTPNLLVCDDVLNDGKKPNKGHRSKSKVTGYGEFGGGKSEYHGIGEYMEVDSPSRYYDLDKWFSKIVSNLS